MKSCLSKTPNGHGILYKEVRFSPPASPTHHDIDPITKPTSSSLDASYLEQARSLFDRQRASFETERELFAGERILWDNERASLKKRIAELEGGSRLSSLSSGGRGSENIGQVWKGSSLPSEPTRGANESAEEHLDLNAALSARSRATATDANIPTGACVPVPIEKLDSRLDGITLKSSALPPEVIARVMTPPSPSPAVQEKSPEVQAKGKSQQSPSSPSQTCPAQHRNTLKLKLSELGPPDKNLTRDAGHTPMAAVVDADTDADQPPSPSEGSSNWGPVSASASQQPTETSDSYFPDLPEDPALKGPLSLLNDAEHDSGFLDELNQKLLDQSRHASFGSARSGDEAQAPVKGQEEDNEKGAETPSQEPELKFKNTTNFGTAFGEPRCGNH